MRDPLVGRLLRLGNPLLYASTRLPLNLLEAGSPVLAHLTSVVSAIP